MTDCGTLMLQEMVPGGDEELWSLGSYLDAQSRPLALFTGHKLRQHPVRFGHVRMAVSRWDQGVADDGVRLLQELHYHGVSQVEFKRDPRDGSDRLMEINARHWMWHSLAAACGVNLSLAAYRDAIGRPYVARRQTDGRKWVVAITDVRDAQAEFRRGERDFLPWLKSYAGVVEDGVLSLRDPVPGLHLPRRQAVRSIVWRRRAKPAAMRPLDIFYDGPPAFAPRAALVPRHHARTAGTARAAGPRARGRRGLRARVRRRPVPGVPTLPLSGRALELFEAARPLPRDAYRELQPSSPPCDEAGRSSATPSGVPGAFPAAPGFAVPFDLVASAFALLACWDEHASRERDRFDRLPFSASVFGANRYLAIERPAVDAYVRLLRAALAPRLAELDAPPLPPVGWAWGEKGFAVALTHDVDNLWRWTREGFVAAARALGPRRAPPRRSPPFRPRRRRSGGGRPPSAGRHGPVLDLPPAARGRGRARPGLDVLRAGGPQRADRRRPAGDLPPQAPRGPGPAQRRRPDGDEVGLHGNAAERLDARLLRADRDDLVRRGAGEIRGIRYHYLRCLYHETLPLVEAAGFAYDSSLAFAEHEGFRCGASLPLPPLLPDGGTPLRLLEVPLAVMDTTLRGDRYRALDASTAEAAARDVLSHVKAARRPLRASLAQQQPRPALGGRLRRPLLATPRLGRRRGGDARHRGVTRATLAGRDRGPGRMSDGDVRTQGPPHRSPT